jgi:hypothetical protein
MTIWARWFNIDLTGVSLASVASGVTTGNFGANQFLYFSFQFPFIIATDSSDKPPPLHGPQ